MQELARSEFVQVLPMTHTLGQNRVFVFSVLEGKHLGRVFVDSARAPTAALVSCACGFHFWLGRADDAGFNQALRHLVLTELAAREERLLLFPCSDAWGVALERLFAGSKPLRIARATFDLSQERFRASHADWQQLVPEGLAVRRYDRALAETAPGLVEFWGSSDGFLRSGLGYAVLKGEEAASRCHAVLVGDGRAEISIECPCPVGHHEARK